MKTRDVLSDPEILRALAAAKRAHGAEPPPECLAAENENRPDPFEEKPMPEEPEVSKPPFLPPPGRSRCRYPDCPAQARIRGLCGRHLQGCRKAGTLDTYALPPKTGPGAKRGGIPSARDGEPFYRAAGSETGNAVATPARRTLAALLSEARKAVQEASTRMIAAGVDPEDAREILRAALDL